MIIEYSFINDIYFVKDDEGKVVARFKKIKDAEKALGSYGPRVVSGGELEKRKSLRGA